MGFSTNYALGNSTGDRGTGGTFKPNVILAKCHTGRTLGASGGQAHSHDREGKSRLLWGLPTDTPRIPLPTWECASQGEINGLILLLFFFFFFLRIRREEIAFVFFFPSWLTMTFDLQA